MDNGLQNRNPVRFKGALRLGPHAVEFYYMRNRWYEPKTGRFLSEDPIGLDGGINPYVFATSDPINGRDPSGLETCWDLWQRMTKWEDGKLVDMWWEYRGRVCDHEPDDELNGGVGGGTGGKGGGQPGATGPGDPDDSCSVLGYAAVLSGIGDAAFLFGGGLVIKSLLGARTLSRATLTAGFYGTSNLFGTSQGRATATVLAGRYATRAAGARRAALAGSGAAAGDALTDAIQATGVGLAVDATGGPGLDWRDFVPVVGTRRAVQAYRACRAGS